MTESDIRQSVRRINKRIEEAPAPPRRTKIKKLPHRLEPKTATPHGNVRRVVDEELQETRSRADGVKRISLGRKSNKLLTRREFKEVTTKIAADINKKLGVGVVTIGQLAKEAKMQEQLARLWLRQSGVKKPGTRWQWPKGSKALAQVREILGLSK